jgi:hypothetical protein
MDDEYYEFIELFNCFDFIGLIFKKRISKVISRAYYLI